MREETQESDPKGAAEQHVRATVRAAEYGRGTLVVIKAEKRGHFRCEFGGRQNSL